MTSAPSLFGMEIHYFDSNPELDAESQYNGNISWIEWAAYNEPVQRYGYSYDGLDRLIRAKYEMEKIQHCQKINQGGFDASYTYDARGNFTSIMRNGVVKLTENTPVFDNIDHLKFSYQSSSNLTPVQNKFWT